MGSVHDDKVAQVFAELTHGTPQKIYTDDHKDAWYYWEGVPDPKDEISKWLYLFRSIEINEIRRNRWHVALTNAGAGGDGEGSDIETAFTAAVRDYRPRGKKG